jgi:hypothetical protein
MTTLDAPPPIPRAGLYDYVEGITFHLAPDGSLSICLPEPNYESTVLELPPEAVSALLAFCDRVDLRRLLARLGMGPPIHD